MRPTRNRCGARAVRTLCGWSCAIVTLVTVLVGCTNEHADDSGGAAPAPPFTILWVGDTLLGDAAQPVLEEAGYLTPFAELRPLPVADYTIVNLEGPITRRTTPWDPAQRWSYNALPPAARALGALGVQAAGLANNHSLDRGPEGLADTRALLAMAGVASFGAGPNDADAGAPLLIETPYGAVAVVAFGEDAGPGRLATRTRPGSLVPSYTAVWRGIDRSRAAGARWVVAFVHWGENYAGVDAEQRRWARRFADAGYDLVIGHGPHLAQPVAFVEGMPVFYSLGNFVFGTPGRYGAGAPGYSVLARVELGPDGFHHADLYCVLTDNARVAFRPRYCPPNEAESVLAALHPDLTVSASIGALSW